MMSKSKGQVLRIAAALQTLFGLSAPHSDEQQPATSSTIVSEDTLTAAIDFVEVCCQQTAYIAGRGNIKEEIQLFTASKFHYRQ